jgi:hypothetical protein
LRSARAERIRERIEWLSYHPSVQTVARVARTFRIDPVLVLADEGEEFQTHLRIAAMIAVGRDEEEAARKAKK